MDLAEEWDGRYREQPRLWSGEPNGTLVAELADQSPGRALDVGCGEGADALWLAERGWSVTAVDVSQVAILRAACAGRAATGSVVWSRVDLAVSSPPAASFELVSAHYFPLRRESDDRALRGLLAAVAPGGVLLFVGHAPGPGVDHEDYYQPAQVAQWLDERWTVEVDEIRPRPHAPNHHTHDSVLRARRR